MSRKAKRRQGYRIDWPVTPIARRVNAAPLHENPVRRFREELRLTRKEFSELGGWDVTSQRLYEYDNRFVGIPGAKRMMKLIQLAKDNRYPLSILEIVAYATEKRGDKYGLAEKIQDNPAEGAKRGRLEWGDPLIQ